VSEVVITLGPGPDGNEPPRLGHLASGPADSNNGVVPRTRTAAASASPSPSHRRWTTAQAFSLPWDMPLWP